MRSKWDNSPRPRDGVKVIPIKELRAAKHADEFLRQTFPDMNEESRKLCAKVMGFFMVPPEKGSK